jgi:hypothetical protein
LPGSRDSGDFHLHLPSLEYPDISDAIAVMKQHHQERFDSSFAVHEHETRDSQSDGPVSHSAQISMIPQKITSPVSQLQVIKQRTLSIERAKELLSSFRDVSIFLPFVVVPETATVQSMARNSPFLLLALLTAASATDTKLHYQLDHEFRRVLSLKVVAEGQRGLDFLQGLLVYIAWYVFFEPQFDCILAQSVI